jgi:prepilin-type N-terminal cleavage/methylation domain-containing protein
MLKKDSFYLENGFTLIEILIVVAIIAILASVVLVGLGPTQEAGRDARRISDLREVQNGLELYYNLCGYYPGYAEPTIPCGAWGDNKGYGGSPPSMTSALEGTPAAGIASVPQDPSPSGAYLYGTNTYGTEYILGATLENPNNTIFATYVPPSIVPDILFGDTPSCIAPTYCVTL